MTSTARISRQTSFLLLPFPPCSVSNASPTSTLPIQMKGDTSGGLVQDILNSLPSFSSSVKNETTSHANTHHNDSNSSKTDGNSTKTNAPVGFKTFVVRSLSTPQEIAVRNEMSLSEFRTINRLNGSYLFPGQIVYVRDPSSSVSQSTLFPFRNVKTEMKRVGMLSYVTTPQHTKGLHNVPENYLEDEVFDDQEFMNESFVRLHCMYVTNGQGMIPGAISLCPDFVEFQPDDTPIANELGVKHCSFHLDMSDLLPPRTQCRGPDFKMRKKLRPPGAFHRIDTSISSLQHTSTSSTDNPTQPHTASSMQASTHLNDNMDESDYKADVFADNDDNSKSNDMQEKEHEGEEGGDVVLDDDALDEIGQRTKSVTTPLSPSDMVIPARPQGNSLVLRSASIGNSGMEADVLKAREKVLKSLRSQSSSQTSENKEEAKDGEEAIVGKGDDVLDNTLVADVNKNTDNVQHGDDVNGSRDDSQCSASELKKKINKTRIPYYLELRLQLVFGSGIRPTPTTTASYWLAVSPKRIDLVYEFLLKHTTSSVIDDWEVIEKEEIKHFSPVPPEPLRNKHIPILTSPSTIVKPEMLEMVVLSMPRLCAMKKLSLIYSSVEHGISLHTLYRHAALNPGPSLLIVSDVNEYVFGSYVSNTWEITDRFYGSGESFLFTIKPEVNIFKWTGENNYVMMGEKEALVVGGGGGKFGLWLDEEFNHGCSEPCPTFANECLASSNQFTINKVELWGFEDSY
eukprot:m.86913 g.86913  ORF g.86913 m.86913 type:complete len:740 (-) comp12227_c0_seq5:214-2433(-)